MGGGSVKKGAKLLASAISRVLVLNVLGAAAWAGPQWCEEDPEFLVNGALVDVTTFFPGDYAANVSRVHFDLQVPSNAVAVVLSLPGTVPATASISRTLPPYWGLLRVPVVLTVTTYTTSTFSTYTHVTGLGGTLLNTVQGTSTYPTKSKFYMYGL